MWEASKQDGRRGVRGHDWLAGINSFVIGLPKCGCLCCCRKNSGQEKHIFAPTRLLSSFLFFFPRPLIIDPSRAFWGLRAALYKYHDKYHDSRWTSKL